MSKSKNENPDVSNRNHFSFFFNDQQESQLDNHHSNQSLSQDSKERIVTIFSVVLKINILAIRQRPREKCDQVSFQLSFSSWEPYMGAPSRKPFDRRLRNKLLGDLPLRFFKD